jgi:DNA polymerase III subunit beta
MELKIGAQELARALARSQGIVEKKSTMPILSHVLLEARKGNVLHVSATDLDLSVSSEHGAEIAKEGAVAVPAKSLYEIVRSLPEQHVTLKKAGNNYLEVKSGASEFRIVGLPAEDFPALPKFERVSFVNVKPAELLEQIDRTSFAASTDETRYNLNGVFFEPQGPVLRMVATDGHRLALSEKPLAGDYALKKGVILPRKGLQELKKLLAEAAEATGEEEVESKLGFVENSAIFRRPGVVLAMRLIEGLFPDYKQVIPKQGEKILKVGRARLLETLRRVSLLASDKSHAVKLELSAGLLRVLSQNPDLGEAKEEVPVDYAGEPLKIGFNARYLTDVTAVLKSDDVQLELADDLSPGVLRGAGPEDAGYTAVVMPMRI